MMMRRHAALLPGLLMILAACEGPVGPEGPQGPQGPSGASLEVQIKTGTIINRNYTEGNPDFVSIPLSPSRSEPTVLFLGIENQNGVFVTEQFSSVIWGGEDTHAVPGTSGWYALIPDRNKDLLNRAYQVKFIQ